MKIFITGGTGFVGYHLSRCLLRFGHHVTVVGRSHSRNLAEHSNLAFISADTTKPGEWQSHVKDSDFVFNLAGKSIFTRWTKESKKQIYDSRIFTTRHLVEALSPNSTLISTSAVGYYGHRGDNVLTEEAPAGDDFLSEIGLNWEKEAKVGETKGVRVAITRFGIILGQGGGALEKMIPAFRSFLGGPIGDGKQWFPWIHVDDVVNAAIFIMENPENRGVFNFTSPNPVRNADFVKTLAKILNRPAIMPAPAFLIRLVAGEFGQTLLNSHRAIPDKLLRAGYAFKYPDLEEALSSIVGV